jgi:hypothetical protein
VIEMVDARSVQNDPVLETAPQFLKLQKSGLGRQARAFRLKRGDVLVAIDGHVFTGDATMLHSVLGGGGSSDPDDEDEGGVDDGKTLRYLLTFWRDGNFFSLIFDNALVARFDFTTLDESIEILEAFNALRFSDKGSYTNFEVFKDIYRNAGMHSIEPDPLATLAPFLWMLNHRLFYPLLGISLVYAITLLTHWSVFVAVYLLVCVYTRRAQLNLLRSYQLFEEKYFWMVFAATSEIDARELARKFDPEVRFSGEKARRRKKKSNGATGQSKNS